VDRDIDGFASGSDVAIYTNIISNRMYGVFAGCRNEWYIGHGFACQLDLNDSAWAKLVFAPAARRRTGCAIAHHLQCLRSLAHRHRQQRPRRLGFPRAKLVQVLSTPSEHNVRVDAMIQRDARHRGAGD